MPIAFSVRPTTKDCATCGHLNTQILHSLATTTATTESSISDGEVADP